ncbi:MAG: hypothetical protein ABW092_12085 [Candidatus Thiodiazotropha sp.]
MLRVSYIVLFLPFIIVLSACSDSSVDTKNLQYRNGVAYLINEKEPYSGNAVRIDSGGNKRKAMTFKDGLKDGIYRKWTKSGQIIQEENYKLGKKNGQFSAWYDNGQNKEEAQYIDNRQDGLQKNGTIMDNRHSKQYIRMA